MKFPIILIVISILLQNNLWCQKTNDKDAKVITISNKAFRDCFVSGKYLWILQSDGSILRLNPTTYQLVDSIRYTKPIVALGNSKTDTVFAADKDGIVFNIFQNRDTVQIWNTGETVQRFLFNSKNGCYLVTDKGIYDFHESFRLYYENAFSRFTVGYRNKHIWHPTTAIFDKDDNIWLGFSAGEWGGDIVLFSTIKKQFIRFRDKIKNPCYFSPVRSILQVDSAMYVTTSLLHMSSLHSELTKITDSCDRIFQSPHYYGNSLDSAYNLYEKEKLYIGPATFNAIDSSIYFYCQFGIFRAPIRGKIDRIENWELVLKPKLLWRHGMPDAVGYAMNVSRLYFEENKLFILSPINGLVIWDSKESVFLKTSYKPGEWDSN